MSIEETLLDLGYSLEASFGMFSERGNRAVEDIVKSSSSFQEAMLKLEDLSLVKGFEEAMDTEVRECVWAVFEK
jgi:hypothetical protein